MFNKILVCLDGSQLAEQILPFAEAHALNSGSRLVLLQAFDVSSPFSASAVRYASLIPDTIEDAMAEEAKKSRDYLDQVAQRLQDKGIEVTKVTLRGAAGNVILHYAASEQMDMIAIATHGRSGLGRTVFGSVADFVLRESGLPILVIKPQGVEKPLAGEPPPFKEILVCLDGSNLAEQILPYAAEEARYFRSKIVLLQAYTLSPADMEDTDQASFAHKEQTLKNEALSYLQTAAKPMIENGLDVACLALLGEAGEVIVGYAQSELAGLIALATHGRSGLGRAIFGSVADHVLRESGLPILLIKPK